VKFRSHSLAIYNNEFILGSACVDSEMIKRIATNMSNGYHFSKRHTCYSVTSHHYSMCTKCLLPSSSTNASSKSWRPGLNSCV